MFVCEGTGVDGGRMPLPTHLQQYCDPTSLVTMAKAAFIQSRQGVKLTAVPNATQRKW